MYKPTWFEPYELVPKNVYESWSPDKINNIWFLFDERMLWTGDRLRELYGPMFINDYHWRQDDPKANQYRGWRPSRTFVKDKNQPWWSDYSQHCRGGAEDLVSTRYTAEKIREDILADPFCEDFKYITCLEIDISWLHFDTRNWSKDKYGILLVKP